MMKKLALILLLFALILPCAAPAEEAAEMLPYYEAYSIYSDTGRFWLEIPNAWDCMDASEWYGYPSVFISDGGEKNVCLAAQLEKDYANSLTVSQRTQVAGFYEEGKAVTAGRSTESSRILEDFTLGDLPAWRVEMVGQDYEMIWLQDGEDLFFLMYPTADADFAARMRGVARTFLAVDSPSQAPAPEADFAYAVADGAAVITAYTGSAAHVLVPDTLGGCPVRALGEKAFYEADVREVILPDGMEEIGAYAFSGCTHLVRLRLPAALRALPDCALESCMRLEWLNLEDTQARTVGDGVFWGNFYLECLGLPDTLETIGGNNFVMCEYLGYFDVSSRCAGFTASEDSQVLLTRDGKTLMHAGCWLGYDEDAYTVPDGVERIAPFAFSSCRSLSAVALPDSLREIGACAFINTAITELHIPAGVERIGCLQAGEESGQSNIGSGISAYYGAPGSAAEAFCAQFDLPFIPEE